MAIPKSVVKQGKVTRKNKNYYVTIGRVTKQIPVGALVSEKEIAKLAGQTVDVTIAGESIIALARLPVRIICYFPAGPILGVVQAEVQQFLEQKYTAAGLLPGE